MSKDMSATCPQNVGTQWIFPLAHRDALSGVIRWQLCEFYDATLLATPKHTRSYRHSTLLPYLNSLSCQCSKFRHSFTTGTQYHMAHAKDVQRYKNVTFHSKTVKTRLERNSILRLNYCKCGRLKVMFVLFSDIYWEYWNIPGICRERRKTRLVILILTGYTANYERLWT